MAVQRFFAATLDEKNRVRIPEELLSALPWIFGDPVQAFLLILDVGRFRLLSPQNVDDSPMLRRLHAQLSQPDEPPEPDPMDFESPEIVALTARLVPTSISTRAPHCRFTVPRAAVALSTAGSRDRRVIMTLRSGYLEIWFPEVVEKALSVRPQTILEAEA